MSRENRLFLRFNFFGKILDLNTCSRIHSVIDKNNLPSVKSLGFAELIGSEIASADFSTPVLTLLLIK